MGRLLTEDEMRDILPGSRIKVFDSLLFRDDKSTP